MTTSIFKRFLDVFLGQICLMGHIQAEEIDFDPGTKDSFRSLFETLKEIVRNKAVLLFLLAFFCYIDGVYTIISMATTYGGEVGIGQTDMILALLLTQFVAFPFAIIELTIEYTVTSGI